MKNKVVIKVTSTREDLECSLQAFQKTGYEKHIKNAVSMCVTEDLDAPIPAEDINWYNAVIRLLIRKEDIFNGKLFGSEIGEQHLRENIQLIYEMLAYYRHEMVRTKTALDEYRKRKKHLTKLYHIYQKLKNELSKQIKLLFPDEQEHLRYLLGAESMFKNNAILKLVTDIEKDFASAKPGKSKNYSQKQHNQVEACIVAIIKIINTYLESNFRIESRMMIWNHYKVLETIANAFYNHFCTNSTEHFDRDTIKGILNDSKH